MKTFDEALDVVMKEIVCEDPEQYSQGLIDAAAFAKESEAEMERRVDLARSIGDNPRCYRFCAGMLEEVSPDSQDAVMNLLIMCFVNGVLIGIDMERQDGNELANMGLVPPPLPA